MSAGLEIKDVEADANGLPLGKRKTKTQVGAGWVGGRGDVVHGGAVGTVVVIYIVSWESTFGRKQK